MADDGNGPAIQRHYADQGVRLWRCNTGVLPDARGIPVRFGLANDSPKLNKQLKCGDYVGWRPRLITPDMVGGVIAEFWSVEAKRDGWTMPNPTSKDAYAHAQAQLRWALLVRSEGGQAGFMTDPTVGFLPY